MKVEAPTTLACGACEDPLIGRMVAIADSIDPVTFRDVGITTLTPDGVMQTVLPLHPICYLGVFNQLMRQEAEAVIEVFVTTTDNFKAGLEI